MPLSRILGIDPGSTHSGWSVLDVTGRKPKVCVCGLEPNERLREMIRDKVHGCDMVAVEKPKGFAYSPARVKALLETGNVAGKFFEKARDFGYEAMEIPCANVRQVLCRRATATDRQVKNSLLVFVDGLPRRTNSHERDATAVALVAYWRHGLRWTV